MTTGTSPLRCWPGFQWHYPVPNAPRGGPAVAGTWAVCGRILAAVCARVLGALVRLHRRLICTYPPGWPIADAVVGLHRALILCTWWVWVLRRLRKHPGGNFLAGGDRSRASGSAQVVSRGFWLAGGCLVGPAHAAAELASVRA